MRTQPPSCQHPALDPMWRLRMEEFQVRGDSPTLDMKEDCAHLLTTRAASGRQAERGKALDLSCRDSLNLQATES